MIKKCRWTTSNTNRDLLLIDGNNLCHRVFWTHRHLSHNGKPVSLLYGFLKSLISLKKKYPRYHFVIAWDSKSERRLREAAEGVATGIIPSGYKANRHGEAPEGVYIQPEPIPDEIQDMFDQMDELQEILSLVRCQQVLMKGFEADDVLYTYARNNAGKTIIVTSDKDYYQLLTHDNIAIFDAMKQEIWTKESFEKKFGFPASSWVDHGALAGDKSDNIFSPDGWGETTATKYIREHQTISAVIKHLQEKLKKYDELAAQYERYRENKNPKDKILKKDIDKYKLKKVEQTLLEQIPRLELAQSLKQMDRIRIAPKLINNGSYDKQALEEIVLKYRFASIFKDVKKLI